jgi:ketosteroid isomerase-like protein
MQAAQEFARRMGHRDIEQAMQYLSPTVVYRVPGQHSLAGSFHGVDAVRAHLLDFAERIGGTLNAYKFEDWLVSENSVAVVVDAHLQGHGATLNERNIFLFRFDGLDRISEISVFFQNQDALERFFSV